MYVYARMGAERLDEQRLCGAASERVEWWS